MFACVVIRCKRTRTLRFISVNAEDRGGFYTPLISSKNDIELEEVE